MRRLSTFPVSALLVLLAATAALGQDGAKPVTLGSLLDEMVDRARYARLPDPAYTLRQASSYERLSKDPADAKGWFANHDWSHFIRSEKVGDRTEWVMLDAAGPGAVVRFWIGGPVPRGTLRFYLDGSAEPALTSKGLELFQGKGPIPPPLSAETARGWNLYLPIPYAKHCKITYDGPNWWQTRKNPDRIWYNINYRTYAAGTKAATLTREAFLAAKGKIVETGKTLLDPRIDMPRGMEPAGEVIPPGQSSKGKVSPGKGPGAIRKLIVRLEADDLAAAARATVLVLHFDGRETVWCPVGDFFGSGVGVNAYKGWWRTVAKDGWMTCYWVMPYRESCQAEFRNLGKSEVTVTSKVFAGPWKWDDRSMYFHAAWRGQFPIDTGKRQDWNYVTVRGQGVYMGDTLAVMNPTRAWWGEGDEKIWVDGEKFPSHFGTGTEDYYGYAWGCTRLFSAPFHAQPRCDGPGNRGHTTVTRTRGLDALPFGKSLKMDMEVWHWQKVQAAYAAATYWYARPGATWEPGPLATEAARTIPSPPPPPKPVKVAGAIEGETMKILEKTGGVTEVQKVRKYKWSGDAQLWWRDAKAGDRLVLELTAPAAGRYDVMANITKAVDYAILQFSLDGEKLGSPMDLYNDGVITTGPVKLGTVDLKAGAHKLAVEITGANPKAEKRYMLGLDYIKLQKME